MRELTMRFIPKKIIGLLLATTCVLQANDENAELLFVRRVSPLFHEKCLACHGNDEKKIKGGFDMRTRAGLLKGGESEKPSVVAGKPDAIGPVGMSSGMSIENK